MLLYESFGHRLHVLAPVINVPDGHPETKIIQMFSLKLQMRLKRRNYFYQRQETKLKQMSVSVEKQTDFDMHSSKLLTHTLKRRNVSSSFCLVIFQTVLAFLEQVITDVIVRIFGTSGTSAAAGIERSSGASLN